MVERRDVSPDGADWFAVRCILRIPAIGAYEERITLWRAGSFEDAVALAESEVEEYARIDCPSTSAWRRRTVSRLNSAMGARCSR